MFLLFSLQSEAMTFNYFAMFPNFFFHFVTRFYTRADVTIALTKSQKGYLVINVRYLLDA